MKKYSKRNGCVFPPDKTFVTRQGMSLRRWMGRWIGTSTACSKTSQTAAVRSGFFHVHQNEKRSHKRLGVPASITPLHNAGHCSVKRMVPATPRRCFQKTDLDTFSFGVSDFLSESPVDPSERWIAKCARANSRIISGCLAAEPVAITVLLEFYPTARKFEMWIRF